MTANIALQLKADGCFQKTYVIAVSRCLDYLGAALVNDLRSWTESRWLRHVLHDFSAAERACAVQRHAAQEPSRRPDAGGGTHCSGLLQTCAPVLTPRPRFWLGAGASWPLPLPLAGTSLGLRVWGEQGQR